MPLTPQAQAAFQLYQVNPYAFNDEEVDWLQRVAKENGIQFQRNVQSDDFNLINTVNQFVSGIVKGFTTLGWADQPENTVEALASNIGQLIGFAPDIIAGVLTGGASLPISLTKKGIIKGGMKTAAGAISRAAQRKGMFALRSLPMRGADAIVKKVEKGLLDAGFKGGKYFAEGKITRDIIKSGVHLGVASGISAWQEGPKGIASSVAHGAIIGAGFGTIGNFVTTSKFLEHTNPKLLKLGQKRVEMAAKALIGAGFQGGMSSLRGDPTPIQVYEYLMGGFFGASSEPVHVKLAHQHITKMSQSSDPLAKFDYTRVDGYENLPKESVDYINSRVKDMWGEILDEDGKLSTAFVEIAKRLLDKPNPTRDEVIGEAQKHIEDAINWSQGKQLDLHDKPKTAEERANPQERVETDITSKPKPIEVQKEKDVEIANESTDLGDDIIAVNSVIDNLVFHVKDKIDKPLSKIQEDLYDMVEKSNYSPDKFLKLLNKYSPDSTRPKGFDRKLKQYMLRKQDVERIEVTYDDRSGKIILSTAYAPPTEATKHFGPKTDFTIKTFINTDGETIRPLTLDENGQPVLSGESLRRLEFELYKSGTYIYEGAKDKGFLVGRRFHPETKKYNFYKDILPKLKKIDPDAEKVFKLDQGIELQRLQANSKESRKWAKALHRNKTVSNILYALDESGFKLQDAVKLYKNVIDRNKRVTLTRGGEYSVQPEMVKKFLDKDGKLRYQIFIDAKGDEFIDSNGKRVNYDSDTDGGEHIRSDVYDALVDAVGLDPNTGFIKPVYAINDPVYGPQYDKLASYRATKAMDEYMFKNNIHVIKFVSGVKVNATRKLYNYEFKDGRYKVKTRGRPKSYQFAPEEMKINTSIYDDAIHNGGYQRIFKQLFSAMNIEQMPEQINKKTGEVTSPQDAVLDKIVRPTIVGNAEVNSRVNEFLSGKKAYSEGLISDGSLRKGINVDSISADLIIKIMFKHPESKMAQDVLKFIMRKGNKERWYRENIDEVKGGEDRRTDLPQLLSMLERSNYDFAVWMDPSINRAVMKAVGDYLVDRTFKPQWKYSGYTRFINNTVELKAKYNVRPGEFYLESRRKNDKILFQGAEMTREEAWKLYTKAKGRGEDVSAMEDDLSFFGGRVPVAGASGVRKLTFKGFIEDYRDGYGMLIHAEDKYNFGGADNDGDGAFFYHGLPKELMDAFHKLKDDLKDGKGRAKNLKEPKLDKDYFGIDKNSKAYKLFHSRISQFMPSMRVKAAEGAYEGIGVMGTAVNTTNLLQNLLSTVNTHGGELRLASNDYTIKLRVKKHPGERTDGEFFRYLGMNAQNRATDAADYLSMAGKADIRQMLFENAFEAVKVDKDGNESIAKYIDLLKTDYNLMLNLNNKLFGYNFLEGRPHTIQEIFEAVNRFNASKIRFEGMLSKMAREFAGELPDFDPMSRIDLDKLVKDLKDQNDSGDFKPNSEFLKFAGRLKLNIFNAYTTGKKAGDAFDPLTLIINDFTDYIITKRLIVPLGKKVVSEVERVGGEKDDGFKIIQQMADDASRLKNQSLQTRRKAKLSDVSQRDAQVRIDNEIRRIRDSLKAQEEAMGLKPGTLQRYFEAYTLSPLKSQDPEFGKELQAEFDAISQLLSKSDSELGQMQLSKEILKEQRQALRKDFNLTTKNNIGWDSKMIPEATKKAYTDIFRKGFRGYLAKRSEGIIDTPPSDKTDPNNPEPTDPKTNNQAFAETVLEHLPEIDWNKVNTGKSKAPLTDEQRNTIETFVSNVKKYELSDKLHTVFPGLTAESEVIGKQIQQATFEDIANFNRYVEHIERSFLFKKYKKGELPMRRAFHYLLYGTIDEILTPHDFKIVERGPTIIATPDGKSLVANASIPMSTLGVNQRTQNFATAHTNKATQMWADRHTKMFSYLAGVENANELVKIAIRYRTRFGDGRSQSNIEDYKKLWEDVKPAFEDMKKSGVSYKIQDEKGNIKVVTAEDLVYRISNDITKYLKDMSEWMVHKPYNEDDVIDPETQALRRSFLLKVQRPLTQETSFSELDIIGFPAINRLMYELNLNAIVRLMRSERTLSPEQETNFRRQYRKDHPPQEIGLIDPSKYFPQRGQFSNKAFAEINNQRLREIHEKYVEGLKDGSIEIPKRYLRLVVKGIITRNEAINYLIDENSKEHDKLAMQSLSEDNLLSEQTVEWMFQRPKTLEEAMKYSLSTRPGSSKSRGPDILPAFKEDLNVLTEYTNEWVKAYFNNMAAIRAKLSIEDLLRRNPLGENTEKWADFMLEEVKRFMGYPSFFVESIYGISPKKGKVIRRFLKGDPLSVKDQVVMDQIKKDYEKDLWSGYLSDVERIMFEHGASATRAKKMATINIELMIEDKVTFKKHLEDLLKNEDRLKAYKTGYSLYSDEKVVNFMDKVSSKLLNGKIPFYGELPKDPETRKQVLARIAHNWGLLEAKFELMTLLTSPKTFIGNMFGGSQNTISSAGLRHFKNAGNTGYLLNNVFQNATFKIPNPKTGEMEVIPLNSRRNISLWLDSIGVIDSFYKTEGGLDQTFKTPEQKAFFKAVVKKIQSMRKANPDITDREVKMSVLELGKTHGITKGIVDKAASFMQKSEIWLRQNSFLAHYLNAREILLPVSNDLKWNDPVLIYFGKKGVEATQFLYHSAFRSNYSNTALGKVMTRFQPFAWNSIRFRRHVYQTAKIYGFKHGTKAFERYQRLVTTDMIAMALGAIFVGSIFEYAMAPPMSWMQDTAQWLFGDEKERERAFFVQWPTSAMAPLQPVTAPILRFPLNLINVVVNGSLDEFSKYYVWTWFPFGRLARDTKKTIENPSMIIENLTGIPVHRLHRLKKKHEKALEAEAEKAQKPA